MCGRKTRAHESVESKKIVKSSEHLKSSELVKSSMMIMMMMNDGDDDDARPLIGMSESMELLTHVAAEMKTPRCGMPESIELYAQIGPASKTRKCTMSESTKLLTQIDAGRGQDPLEDACLERQRMREFNGLFCQIALGDHNV
mgnify:CR=1 FL=1